MTVLLGDEFAPVLAAAQAGDDWAVARIYRSLQPAVLAYLRVREPNEAEDIAAQTWLEVARALTTFSGTEQNFRAFVFTIARRRLLNARRSRARRRTDLVDNADLVAMIHECDDLVDQVAARVDGPSAIQRITDLLRADQAEVVLLRVVAGLTVEEVAAIVGKRAVTIRVIQHRALEKLRKELDRSVTPPKYPGM
jgi:RNA polymerase sigma-70 factor (ECF subfamily)